jgi:hypothetical protein
MLRVSPLLNVILPALRNPDVEAPTPIVNPAVPMLKVVAEESNLPPSEITNAESLEIDPLAPSLSVPLLMVVAPV